MDKLQGRREKVLKGFIAMSIIKKSEFLIERLLELPFIYEKRRPREVFTL